MPPVTGSHLLSGLAMSASSMSNIRPTPYVPIRPQSFISVPSRGLPDSMMKSYAKESINMTGKGIASLSERCLYEKKETMARPYSSELLWHKKSQCLQQWFIQSQ